MLKDHELAVTSERDAGVRPVANTARQYRRLARWTVLTDALSVDAAMILTRFMRHGFDPVGRKFVAALILAPLAWVGLLAAFQLYSISRLSPAEEFRRLLEATVTALALGFVLVFMSSNRPGGPSDLWLALTWAEALVFLMISRKIWHRYRWRLHSRGELLFRTLVVGANNEAVKLADVLHNPSFGFRPIGLVETEGQWAPPLTTMPILGTIDDLSELIETHDVECVFVASSAVGTELMKRVAKQLRRQNVEVRISANLTQILSSRLSVQPVGDVLALSLKPVRLSGPQAVAKRIFDLCGASAVLILGSPFWLTLALLVKTTSRGPVLYRQKRVGHNGRLFTMYKFRTMVAGADAMLKELMQRNEADGPLFKMRQDPRVTRFGRWLRKFSLDELPQLLNVVKGQMSLVGPRPALPNEVDSYEDWHHDRLEVPPGITGLWQVRGRSELGFDDYVRLDLFYIENWSIMYDLFILAKTVPTVLSRRGAF
jgi:exopolysaccharide biosynthesis polyprenyl glycosylphosphotransferase